MQETLPIPYSLFPIPCSLLPCFLSNPTKLWGMLEENGFYSMLTTTAPAEQRILLLNITWQTFKAMLADMGSERVTRLAYDSGTVEIMTPLMPHENSNRLIEVFVGVLCEELGLEIKRNWFIDSDTR